MTLLRPRRSITVAASGPRAEALDEIQYHYGDGPCLAAAREHRVVRGVSATPRPAVRLAQHRDTAADLAAAMASRTTVDLAAELVSTVGKGPASTHSDG